MCSILKKWFSGWIELGHRILLPSQAVRAAFKLPKSSSSVLKANWSVSPCSQIQHPMARMGWGWGRALDFHMALALWAAVSRAAVAAAAHQAQEGMGSCSVLFERIQGQHYNHVHLPPQKRRRLRVGLSNVLSNAMKGLLPLASCFAICTPKVFDALLLSHLAMFAC